MSKWQCSACEGGPCSYEDKLTREECGAVGPEECPRRWQDSNWQPSDGGVMFVCDKCLHGVFVPCLQSVGPRELCGEKAACSDVTTAKLAEITKAKEAEK